MKLFFLLFQLLVLRISYMNAVTLVVDRTLTSGTYTPPCSEAEEDEYLVDGGVDLTCMYTLSGGETITRLQWIEHSEADGFGAPVYNSDGVANGAVQPGNLQGRAAGSFTGTTNTLAITDFTSDDIPGYVCRVTVNGADVDSDAVTIPTPVIDDQAALSNIEFQFDGNNPGSTIETSGDVELTIMLDNIVDGAHTYPCADIVVSGPSDSSCSVTGSATQSMCTITIAESEYRGGDLEVEAHGRMALSTGTINGTSASVTIIHTVENQKVKELTATQCAGIWTATVTWKGPYSPKPILQWNRGGSETKCTDKEYKDSKDPKDKEHTRKCVRTFTHRGKVEVTVYVNGSKGISASVTIIPWWLVFIIVIIIVAVVLTCVGLYCCKKHNICCWKKRTTSTPVAPGVPYTVEVTTGDKNNAATSARVFIIMYGGKDGNRNSGKVWLEGGAFTRGHTAVFNVEVADMLSPLARIDIGHDNSGAVAGWFLDRVSVKCPSAGMEKMFRCDKWLAVDEGDGAIERTLYETTHKDKKKMDTSHKYKSSDHAN